MLLKEAVAPLLCVTLPAKNVLYKKEVNRVLYFSLALPFLSSFFFWFICRDRVFSFALYRELMKNYWEFRNPLILYIKPPALTVVIKFSIKENTPKNEAWPCSKHASKQSNTMSSIKQRL